MDALGELREALRAMEYSPDRLELRRDHDNDCLVLVETGEGFDSVDANQENVIAAFLRSDAEPLAQWLFGQIQQVAVAARR